jgi:16S rRNA (uracil1498-N3)-methyltransferase
MEYFFTPPSHISKTHLTIEGDEFAHLTHVMRRKIGEVIRVVDGIGSTYEVVIESLNKHVAQCSIRLHFQRLHEPTTDLTLAVGILKNHAKFDFLVEKCTELGVKRIVPLLTERTIPRHAKIERWQKLALAAMKQSERCVLPAIDALTSFDDFVKASKAEAKVIAHEKAEGSPTVAISAATIAICIGPEGGFTEEEVTRAEACGFQLMTLGERRLRTETAAIVASARILACGHH